MNYCKFFVKMVAPVRKNGDRFETDTKLTICLSFRTMLLLRTIYLRLLQSACLLIIFFITALNDLEFGNDPKEEEAPVIFLVN